MKLIQDLLKINSSMAQEGVSDMVKGVKRKIAGKEHPDVVAAKHAGRAMGHYNQGDIEKGDKESARYMKVRDMHLKAKGVTEDEETPRKVIAKADEFTVELDEDEQVYILDGENSVRLQMPLVIWKQLQRQ